MAKYYEYSVNLDDRYVRVVATDKLIAGKMGANALGVVWRERARDMVIIQGREVKRKEIEKLQAADNSSTAKAEIIPANKPTTAEKRSEPTFKRGPLAGQKMKGGR